MKRLSIEEVLELQSQTFREYYKLLEDENKYLKGSLKRFTILIVIFVVGTTIIRVLNPCN